MAFNTTAELIEAIKNGEMIVLLDDEDRENEGDIIIAAQKVTTQAINFMATHARGLICMPMSKSQCERLRLPLMVPFGKNGTQYGTNFTVSIEAKEGVTTGISAPDRKRTIEVAANPSASWEDIVQPGHIFPLMAQPGGVLERAGHTEAACDLARLAGLHETAVLAEIMSEDGTMARRPELEVFAKTHGLKIGSIADLIRYRLQTESTIAKIVESTVNTQFGTFRLCVFQDLIHKEMLHIAYVCGEPNKEEVLPVRVMLVDKFSVLPGIKPYDKHSWPLNDALAYIQSKGKGAVVLLAKMEEISETIERLGCLHLEEPSTQPVKRPNRIVGVGAQVLSQLGFGAIEVLGANEKYSALSGFGLEIKSYLPFGVNHEL